MNKTEDLMKARREIIDELKRKGIKISHVPVKDITRMAYELLKGKVPASLAKLTGSNLSHTKYTIRVHGNSEGILVNTDELPDKSYKEALCIGLETLLCRGALKISQHQPKEDKDRQRMELAKTNLDNLYKGLFKSRYFP